jgi:hypothetical protein
LVVFELGDFEEEPALVAAGVAVHSQEQVVLVRGGADDQVQVAALEI